MRLSPEALGGAPPRKDQAGPGPFRGPMCMVCSRGFGAGDSGEEPCGVRRRTVCPRRSSQTKGRNMRGIGEGSACGWSSRASSSQPRSRRCPPRREQCPTSRWATRTPRGRGSCRPAPTAPPECGQSEQNYPHLVADALKLTLTDVSCGGAKTENFKIAQYPLQPPQFDALSESTEVISVGMGGNDHNLFGTLVQGCSETDTTTGGEARARKSTARSPRKPSKKTRAPPKKR